MLRRPLPPDLRKEMKRELQKVASRLAGEVGDAGTLCASRVADAKAAARSSVRKAEQDAIAERRSIVSSFEARAAERRVAEGLYPKELSS